MKDLAGLAVPEFPGPIKAIHTHQIGRMSMSPGPSQNTGGCNMTLV